jgi:integrase/recombinase XerD
MTLDNIPFNECTYKSITDFLDWLQSERRCSSSTRNQRLFVLKSFLKYVRMKYLEWVSLRYEMEKVAIQKKENKLIDIIPEDALKTILEQPNPDTKCGMRNPCFMVLMYDTAARDREMFDLTIGSLHSVMGIDTKCQMIMSQSSSLSMGLWPKPNV